MTTYLRLSLTSLQVLCLIFFFGRVDWPLLLSCFACLWHETLEADKDTAELAESEALHSYAFSWRLRNGIAPHPSRLLADSRARRAQPRYRITGKKRPFNMISIK